LNDYVSALLHSVRRVDDNGITILQSTRDVYLCAKIASDMDLSHMNHTVLDNGHELALCARYDAIAGDQDSGIGGIEVQLHGSEHPRTETMLRVRNLDLQQQGSGLLT
jgi:hypothetical protein